MTCSVTFTCIPLLLSHRTGNSLEMIELEKNQVSQLCDTQVRQFQVSGRGRFHMSHDVH